MFISRRSLVYTLTVLIIVAVSVTLISAGQGKSGRGTKKGKKQVTALDKRGELMSGRAMEADLSGMEGYGGFTGTGRPPRFSNNVQVNDPQAFFPNGLVGRSETSIVTLKGGQRLVAGWNDADGFCGFPFGVPCTPPPTPGLSGFGFSSDGGQTWTDGGAPPLFDNIFTVGDPWLDRGGFDKDTIFYSNIGLDLSTFDFGISIHRGHFDGSNNFAWEDVRFITPEFQADFLDKEALAANKDGSGVVIVSLTNFLDLSIRGICPAFSPIGFGQIEVFRSADGGNTYSGPIVVGPDLTDLAADPNCNIGVSQQSSSSAFGPNGEVYVVWERGPTFGLTDISPGAEIVVARSLNSGMNFDSPVVVASINHMRGAPPVAYNRNRINNHPRLAVVTEGTHKGRVLVAFSSMVSPVSGVPVTVPPASCPPGVPQDRPCVAQNLTSSQVFVSHSDDQGATWSAPVPLAPAPPPTGLKRLWPTVSIEPGGAVDVIYYENQERGLTPDPNDIECNRTTQGNRRRAGTAVSLVDTFWARSGDGGASFNSPVRASDVSTNWCQVGSNIIPNMGDYIFSVSKGDHVFPVWADGRNGIPDTFYATGLGAGKSKK